MKKFGRDSHLQKSGSLKKLTFELPRFHCSYRTFSLNRSLKYTGPEDRLGLTLNAPIATKVVCFSRLLKCLRSLHGKQCVPRSDCSYGSSLFWVHPFASILNLSVMLGNYLQQTTSADDIFRCIFFLALQWLIEV